MDFYLFQIYAALASNKGLIGAWESWWWRNQSLLFHQCNGYQFLFSSISLSLIFHKFYENQLFFQSTPSIVYYTRAVNPSDRSINLSIYQVAFYNIQLNCMPILLNRSLRCCWRDLGLLQGQSQHHVSNIKWLPEHLALFQTCRPMVFWMDINIH